MNKTEPLIRITARRDGFRRAGIAHSARPVEYPLSRFSDAELAALEAEPMLVVERVDLTHNPEGESGKEGAGAAAAKTAPATSASSPARRKK
jgi:hypothetical protein